MALNRGFFALIAGVATLGVATHADAQQPTAVKMLKMQ